MTYPTAYDIQEPDGSELILNLLMLAFIASPKLKTILSGINHTMEKLSGEHPAIALSYFKLITDIGEVMTAPFDSQGKIKVFANKIFYSKQEALQEAFHNSSESVDQILRSQIFNAYGTTIVKGISSVADIFSLQGKI
jgi:hypothetical protein